MHVKAIGDSLVFLGEKSFLFVVVSAICLRFKNGGTCGGEAGGLGEPYLFNGRKNSWWSPAPSIYYLAKGGENGKGNPLGVEAACLVNQTLHYSMGILQCL